MKNISRRVFIKGLAVAGVAAAASTVLAGCNTNMIPGNGNGADDQPETPADSKVLTFTNPEDSSKTFTLTFSDMAKGSVETNNKDKGYVAVSIDNKMGKAVVINDASGYSTAINDYMIDVAIYADGLTSKTGVATFAKKSYAVGTDLTRVELDLTKANTSVTFKVSMKQMLDTTHGVFKPVGEAQTITYTL